MIRCPDDVAPERREVHGGEFTLGRGDDNQWVIPDPERHVSKKHCRVVYAMGDWELHDLSSNGTYLNHAAEPLGRGIPQKLQNGDRITFGPYELEVQIEGDAPVMAERTQVMSGRARGDFLRDPPPATERGFAGEGLSDPIALDSPNSPILPHDFDPLAPAAEPFQGSTQADHAPALQSAFRPPQPVAIIPDDWDVDLPAAAAARPQPAAAPAPPREEAPTPQPVPPPSRPVPAPPPAARNATDEGLLAAFLRGVGLNDMALSDPEKTLERLGAAARATVTGLRKTLMARASIKDEFRIAQTVIRASGNNPLKFSLDDDDALATLLGTDRRGSMPADEAITEAFNDLRLHELATISAMQAAVRALLEQFAPEAIERKSAGSATLQIGGQRKAKAWDTFVQQHRTITHALSDDFDSVFGKAFARAYEQAIEELAGGRKAS